MKDAVATMGGILPDDAGGRDAVHVAVFSATSPVRVYAGQKVGTVAVAPEGDAIVSPVVPPTAFVGIVDPFVSEDLHPGVRFWVFLFPRTITALAHRWSHPAFEQTASVYRPPSGKLASEEWLRAFCDGSDCPSYEEVIAEAAKFVDGRGDAYDDEYLHFNGRDAHGEIPAEFWQHVEVVLGRKVPEQRPTYFSCAC